MMKLQDIPKRLTRITSSGKYIPQVDGLRFVAILPVLLQHLSERLYRYSPVEWSQPIESDPVAFMAGRGTIGVFIFFAISGFILALPFANYHLHGGKKIPYKKYLWRRVTRLEPPYLIWMSLFFVILLLRGVDTFSHLFPHFGASIFYLHNLTYAEYSPINPVAWSLEIEIQFYLLAPFLAAFFFSVKNKIRRRVLLIGTILVWLTAQHALGWNALPYKYTVLWQLPHFLAGFFLADLFLTDWRERSPARSYWFDLLAPLAFLTLCFTWSEEYGKNLVFSAALILLLYAGFRSVWFQRFLANPWIAAIGGMCYTIYLIHLPLIEGLIRVTRYVSVTNIFAVNFVLQILLIIPVVLAISAVAFLYLEKPFMDKTWPQRLWQWLRSFFPLTLKKVEQ